MAAKIEFYEHDSIKYPVFITKSNINYSPLPDDRHFTRSAAEPTLLDEYTQKGLCVC